MTKQEILKQLNQLYLDKQKDEQYDYENRFQLAMKNPMFNQKVKEKNNLNLKIKEAQDNNQDITELLIEKKKIAQDLLYIIDKCNIDLKKYYSCPLCKDTGFVNGKICECKKSLFIAELRNNSNLPSRSDFTFATNKILELNVAQSKFLNKLYTICESWVNNFDLTTNLIMFLSGNVGVGKTTLAISTANALIESTHSVYYSTAFELNNLFMDKQFNRLKTADQYNQIMDCDLLIIDDLGTEVTNIIGLDFLFAVIDNRINNNKKIMICTNLTLANFSKKYGERATSRLTNKQYSIATQYITGLDLRKI